MPYRRIHTDITIKLPSCRDLNWMRCSSFWHYRCLPAFSLLHSAILLLGCFFFFFFKSVFRWLYFFLSLSGFYFLKIFSILFFLIFILFFIFSFCSYSFLSLTVFGKTTQTRHIVTHHVRMKIEVNTDNGECRLHLSSMAATKPGAHFSTSNLFYYYFLLFFTYFAILLLTWRLRPKLLPVKYFCFVFHSIFLILT